MRDDFSSVTKRDLALRVHCFCSNPACPLGTVGPHSDGVKSINKGVAAHITAASPGGMRYDSSLTEEERSSSSNGIWLCQNCAKLIDSDAIYSVELLHAWKSKTEAEVQISLHTNSPLVPASDDFELLVSASYAGGIRNDAHIQIRIFNAGSSPIYIMGWFANWLDNEQKKSATMSCNTVSGTLPFRLQSQDYHTLVIDIGERPVRGLQQLSVIDGKNRHWEITRHNISVIKHQYQRYEALMPKPDTIKNEPRLDHYKVEINAVLKEFPESQKRLEFVFTSKSDMSIQLRGAKLEWEYDPPRVEPTEDGITPKVSEVGGSVGLACDDSLQSQIKNGDVVVFYVSDDMAGILIETIMGDVKDESIKVFVYTDTDFAWVGTGDEIPGIVREMAQYVLQQGQSQS